MFNSHINLLLLCVGILKLKLTRPAAKGKYDKKKKANHKKLAKVCSFQPNLSGLKTFKNNLYPLVSSRDISWMLSWALERVFILAERTAFLAGWWHFFFFFDCGGFFFFKVQYIMPNHALRPLEFLSQSPPPIYFRSSKEVIVTYISIIGQTFHRWQLSGQAKGFRLSPLKALILRDE